MNHYIPALLILILVSQGCRPTLHNLTKEDRWSALEDLQGREVRMTLGLVNVECLIGSVTTQNLQIVYQGETHSVPIRAISKIEASNNKQTSYTIGGSVAGAATGAALGYGLQVGISQIATGNSDIGFPLLAVIAGAVGAYVGGSKAMRAARDKYVINTDIRTIPLASVVGDEVTADEIEKYGLFSTLPQQPNEHIVLVQIFEYQTDAFIVVYDTVRDDQFKVNWKTWTATELDAERRNITQNKP